MGGIVQGGFRESSERIQRGFREDSERIQRGFREDSENLMNLVSLRISVGSASL